MHGCVCLCPWVTLFMCLHLTIRVCVRVRLSRHVCLDFLVGRDECERCVCVSVRYSESVYDKYSVFISMSGGVSGGQGDRFLLVGRRRMESNDTPLGPSALDSQNHKQHPAHKPPSALSQYLFALITQNVIVRHAGYVCLSDRLPC